MLAPRSKVNDSHIIDNARVICTPSEITPINNCKIFLKLLTIPDMTSIDWRHILKAYFTGGGHQVTGRRSLLNWPEMEPPPASHWTIWRSFFHRWIGAKLLLPKPLGDWYKDAGKKIYHCAFFTRTFYLSKPKKDSWISPLLRKKPFQIYQSSFSLSRSIWVPRVSWNSRSFSARARDHNYQQSLLQHNYISQRYFQTNHINQGIHQNLLPRIMSPCQPNWLARW